MELDRLIAQETLELSDISVPYRADQPPMQTTSSSSLSDSGNVFFSTSPLASDAQQSAMLDVPAKRVSLGFLKELDRLFDRESPPPGGAIPSEGGLRNVDEPREQMTLEALLARESPLHFDAM